MKFLAKIAPKTRASWQIGAVEPLLNLLFQRIRRPWPGFFLFSPAAQAFTDHIAGVQVRARLELLGHELFQRWSQSDFRVNGDSFRFFMLRIAREAVGKARRR